jgi:hypothetical protein
VAYLASEPGTYTNFGGIVIASGLYSLTYASGTWTGTQMRAGSDIEVVQTTGQSTSAVMSQKAVTDIIDGRSTTFSVIGKGNTYAASTESNKYIKVGNTYRLWVLNPDVSMSGVSGLADTAGRLSAIFYQANNTLIEERKFATWKQSLAEFYDFTIPSNCASIKVGGRCASGATLKLALEDITLSWENTKEIRNITSVEEGVYRKASGTSDAGYQLDPLYGLGTPVQVSKGDTVLWHYGSVDIRTMLLCVYDENGDYVGFYNNTTANERLIENFMSRSALDKFLIRASLLIANGSDNYVEVNGVRVWTAFNESLGNKFNKIDKVVNPYTDVSFYNKSISTTTGVEAETTKRLSTSYIVHRGRYILSVADGYLIHSVNYYDENKTWYKGIYPPAQTVITEQQDIEGYIKIVVTNQDNTTDIALDAPINLTFNTYSGGSLNEFDDALRMGTFNSSYNNTDVEAVRNKYCGLIKGKSKIENFLFFTDPHLTPNSRYEEMTEAIRDRFISTLQKYYNSLPMDFCICGGDWLNFNHPNNTDCEWLGYCDAYMRKLFRNYYPVFGNHDNNPYTPSNTESNWLNALTYPTIMNLMFRENGRTYYSFDGLNTKFYVMNSGVSFIKGMTNSTYSRLVSNRWPQIEWLGNALLQDDAENSVVVMHIYSNASNPVNWFSEETGYRAYGIHDLGKNVKLLVTAYNNRQSITLNGITYNFANCNGRVMFIHCGHTHFDYVDTTGEVPIISTTNLEGGHLVNGEIVYDLVPTFDCCMNDLDNSALYMTRVGAGSSRIVNCTKQDVSAGSSITLTSKLSGTVTWQTRNSSIATVSNGIVTGVASGCTGIIATNENSEEEYWIVKVV